jgi:hypothetical protein
VVVIVAKDYKWWPLAMRDVNLDDAKLTGNQENNGRAKYTVLGWYLIRDSWAELEPGEELIGSTSQDDHQLTPLFIRWKFAFEWVKSQGKPWWIQDLEDIPCDSPIDESYPEATNLQPDRCTQRCFDCLEISVRIYYEGWFCLNHKCSRLGLVSIISLVLGPS